MSSMAKEEKLAETRNRLNDDDEKTSLACKKTISAMLHEDIHLYSIEHIHQEVTGKKASSNIDETSRVP